MPSSPHCQHHRRPENIETTSHDKNGIPVILEHSTVAEANPHYLNDAPCVTWRRQLSTRRETFFAFVKTKEFWLALLLGWALGLANKSVANSIGSQVLAVANTGGQYILQLTEY